MRLAVACLSKSCDQTFHGGPRSDFALVVSANAVRQCKQPTVRAHLRRRLGSETIQVVLIVVANPTQIRELRELKVEHEPVRSEKYSRF